MVYQTPSISSGEAIEFEQERDTKQVDLEEVFQFPSRQVHLDKDISISRHPPGRGDPVRAGGIEYSVVDMESDALCWNYFAEAAAGDVVRSP